MKLSRRTCLATLPAAALALTSCSNDSPEPTTSGQAELTFWGTYGNGGNSAQTDVLTKELLPAFHKANPTITVKYVDMPYDGLKQKLTTGAAGGELPDLLRSDIGWIAQFGKMGAFKALDEELPTFDELSKAVFPGTLAANHWDGHYYGLPLNTNTRVLVANPDALKEAGFDKPPASFDDMRKLGEALKGKKVQAFAEAELSAWAIMPWIWSAGGDIADPDMTRSTGVLDSSASVAGLQLLVDLYRQDQIPNLIVGNKGATATSDGLPGGNYATILDGPWMTDIWDGQYPDFKPIYAPVPAGDGGSISVVGGESIVVTEETKNAEAAFKFVEFALSDEYQLGMAKAGQMSVKPGLSSKQTEVAPHFEVFAEQLETAKSRLPHPNAGEIDEILNQELVKAFDGSATAQDVLSAAASRIDDVLAK